nr:MAG TPA: hypothetical protein [Caudoviricetes sp.]
MNHAVREGVDCVLLISGPGRGRFPLRCGFSACSERRPDPVHTWSGFLHSEGSRLRHRKASASDRRHDSPNAMPNPSGIVSRSDLQPTAGNMTPPRMPSRKWMSVAAITTGFFMARIFACARSVASAYAYPINAMPST